MGNNYTVGFKEICAGKSPGSFLGKPIFFKHSSLFSQLEIEEERDRAGLWAKNHGLPSRAEQISKLKGDSWNQEKEANLQLKVDDYKMLWQKRSKIKRVGMVSTIRSLHEQLREMKVDIDLDYVARDLATPECQESYAGTRCFDYGICLLSEREDGERFFTEDEYDFLSDFELSYLRNEYSKVILKFDEDFFKRLAVSNSFYSLFDNYISNPADFFQKPGPDLTAFQINLLRNAKRFNEILKIAWDAPSDFFDDPDCLETYAIVKNNTSDEPESDGSDVESNVAEMKRNRS